MKPMKLTAFFAAQVPLVEATGEAIDLNAVVKSRAAFVAGLEPMREPQRVLEALCAAPTDPEAYETAAEQDERRRHAESLRVLIEGDWSAGITDPLLEPFVGTPGIRNLERWIAKCDEVIARETELRSMKWPAPYRYVGGPGLMRWGAPPRVLRKGDVILLSRAQAEAFADRVERVTNEEVTA
ncbi:MAG TPA: hypothetical protein VM364_18565 [Vicinamibacterales bacterium]|nr:hypothetical protein [Vicinamibacterales bacterium]